jgi:hypothetical protein
MSRAEAFNNMQQSKDEIEQRLGERVSTFAYPYGDVPDGYDAISREAGYTHAVSIFSRSFRVTGDRYAMRRVILTNRDVGMRLRAKLSEMYMVARPFIVDRRVLRSTGTSPRRSVGESPLDDGQD